MKYRPSHVRRHVAVLMIALVLLPNFAFASWLSQITGIDINVPAGTISFSTPDPAAIPEMLKNLPADILTFVSSCVVAAFETRTVCPGMWMATLIREGKAAAQGGSQPIPQYQRSQLQNFFPAYILDKARWTLANPNRSPIERLVFGGGCPEIHIFSLYISCGNGALTLDNLIIFQDIDHETDYVRWAHELTHVSQYDGLGIDGFAYAYTVDPMNLEGQAYAWENTVRNAMTPQFNQQPQRYWTMQNVRRAPLTGNDFVAGAGKLLSNPAWVQAHSVWGSDQDCVGVRGPGTNTGIIPGTDTGIPYQDSDRHFNAGLAYESAQNWAMAATEYREAARTNPGNAKAFDRLGVALARTGQAQQGLAQIKHAICLDTSKATEPGFRADLAYAYSASGALGAAVNEYQMAIFWSDSQAPQLRRDLASVLDKAGQSDAAKMQIWGANLISNGSPKAGSPPPLPTQAASAPSLPVNAPSLPAPEWLRRVTWEVQKKTDWYTPFGGRTCRTTISERVLFDARSDSPLLQYVKDTQLADDASDFCFDHANDPAIKTHVFVRLRLTLSAGTYGSFNFNGALENPCLKCSLPAWSPKPTASGMIIPRTTREFWLAVDGLVHGGFQMEPSTNPVSSQP